ncbi:MAG TPA: hypothetical protein VFK09_05855 [Gemmatimonadales bacterium]|nr:hypothetical protein [Gemmatimonadales bacterium]
MMTVGSRRAIAIASSLVIGLVMVAGCEGGGGGKYAGSYKRDLSNEGEVQMKLAGDNVELTLPSPRWADSPTLKARSTMKGDTLVFPADSALACAGSEAKYVLSREGENLQVAGVGMDPCGGRRAAMVGSWEKS